MHSAEDMNFRVHLQYEFTILGLDEFLSNKLRLNDNEKLQMEIQVYLDNQLDVHELVEDADQKIIKEKELEDLNQELLAEKDKFNDALNKITELQKQNETLMIGRTLLKSLELNEINVQSLNESFMVPTLPLPAPPLPLSPLPPKAPPPPPPPLTLLKIFNTPPIPSINIKHSIETKFELPYFNWTPFKPQEIQGTLFSELNDDENLLKIIDFDKFEDSFKISKIISNINSDNRKKKIENVSLLEKEHQRNIGKSIMKPFLMNKFNSLPKMVKLLLNIFKT